MKGNRRRDTKPELPLRRLLHGAGLRYRVDARPDRQVRVRADIVFGPARVAVFVDGCFWHRCPEHGTWPKSNSEFWRRKFAENVSRDLSVNEALASSGWHVIRVWEHEDPGDAADRIGDVVASRRAMLETLATRR